MKPTIKLYLAVGLGGMIGAVLRYILSILLVNNTEGSFPLATFIVNMSGSFFLSFLLFAPFIQNRVSPAILTALTTGVIGSYTTFSTIQLEIVQLLNQNIGIAISYIFMTIIFGLLFSYLGFRAAKICRERTDH